MGLSKITQGGKWQTFLIPLLLILIGGWAYRFSHQLPLFFDDIPHFVWLYGQDFIQILGGPEGLSRYYRPLPFLIWKILWSLQGTFHPPTLHTINLALHLLNGVLVWIILYRHTPSRGGLLSAAGVLFLLYPFSYQAVPSVSSLTHPLVTSMILGSLCLYTVWERHRWRAFLISSLALALLAPFAHETGILLPLLLVLFLVTREEPLQWKTALRSTRFYWLCALVGLGVWLIVPKNFAPSQVWNLEARYQNGVYFLQGLMYPVAPLARSVLAAGWGLDDLQSILLVSLPVALIWGLLLWRAGGGRLLLLAVGWFALTAAPAWMMLGFEYVIDGPRLLYLPSVGAALFWAIPLALPSWNSRRLSFLKDALTIFLTLLIGLSGGLFVRERAAMYEQLRQFVAAFVRSVRSIPTDPVLCVNCPLFLAPIHPTFAVGHEGVPICSSDQLDDLFWVNTGQMRRVEGLVFPDLQQHWKYHYGGAGPVNTSDSMQAILREYAGVILTNYGGEDLTVYPVGMLEAQGMPPQTPFLAEFGGRIRLLSASVDVEGTTMVVTLRWQSLEPLEEEATVFLHLVSASGELVAQRDGYPLMGLSRPALWVPGDIWRDIRYLWRSGIPGDTYTLKVGLYPVNGGPRLKAFDPFGAPIPDDAFPLAILALP
jgi:hypothetical protein